MAQHVVIGAGPDAVRAAAVRATAGVPVLLLQETPQPLGLAHPELPQDTGRMRVPPEHRALTEGVLGALVEAPDLGRGVLERGRTAWLPMHRRDLVGLLPPAELPRTARSFLQARSTATASQVVAGSGQEERSYQDWVVRRFGPDVYRLLLQDYAERRFGAPGEALSVTVARLHHGVPDPGPHQVAGGRADVSLREAAARIRAAGGEIRAGVQIEALELAEGRVAAVLLAGGERLPVEGRVWVARPPHVVATWLPAEALGGLGQDAQRLATADLLVTCLKGEVDGLPEVLHVLDRGAAFWSVVSPYGIKEYALFLATIPRQAPPVDPATHAARVAEDARRLGLGEFEVEGARLERVRDHQPTWLQGWNARFHRVVDRYAQLGLVAVGRAGTGGELDPGEEIALAAAYAGEGEVDQREVLRQRVDPPARLDDLRTSLRRFIER